MKLIADLFDNEYPNTGFSSIRKTVRGIILNETNQIAFLRLKGEDFFGMRNHLETVGGGIEKNETDTQALQREAIEEIGKIIEVVQPIAFTINRYNLIERITISRFYLCRVIGEAPINRTDNESELIECIEWLSLDEALNALSISKNAVDRLVHERERKVLEYIKDSKLTNLF